MFNGPVRCNELAVSISGTLSAFDQVAVGTAVNHAALFFEFLSDAINDHNWSSDRVKGQAFLILCGYVNGVVSAGVGRTREDPDAYVLRCHRGRVGAYLKRCYGGAVTDVSTIVYTKEAYLNDPDIDEVPGERERIIRENPTHVLVAVLASVAGAPVSLTPYRFIANLAGGNKEALVWDADEIRERAREVKACADVWSVVSD